MNFISCRYIIFLEENFINRYQIHQCNIGLKRFRYCTVHLLTSPESDFFASSSPSQFPIFPSLVKPQTTF
jgi:hypothetical protein